MAGSQCGAQLVYCRMQAMVEVHESVGWPDSLLEFFAGYNFAWFFQERLQYLQRLLLKTNTNAALAQFASAQI
jgi:hypothetical protein